MRINNLDVNILEQNKSKLIIEKSNSFNNISLNKQNKKSSKKEKPSKNKEISVFEKILEKEIDKYR